MRKRVNEATGSCKRQNSRSGICSCGLVNESPYQLFEHSAFILSGIVVALAITIVVAVFVTVTAAATFRGVEHDRHVLVAFLIVGLLQFG